MADDSMIQSLTYIIQLMKTKWDSLDPLENREISLNGFKALKQLI